MIHLNTDFQPVSTIKYLTLLFCDYDIADVGKLVLRHNFKRRLRHNKRIVIEDLCLSFSFLAEERVFSMFFNSPTFEKINVSKKRKAAVFSCKFHFTKILQEIMHRDRVENNHVMGDSIVASSKTSLRVVGLGEFLVVWTPRLLMSFQLCFDQIIKMLHLRFIYTDFFIKFDDIS